MRSTNQALSLRQVHPVAKRALDDIARFLRFAVDVCGMPKRYLPPDTNRLKNWWGSRQFQQHMHSHRQSSQTCLLNYWMTCWKRAGSVNMLPWRLLDIAGIRPSELATLHQVDGQARVVSTKRNTKQMKHPPEARDIFPWKSKGETMKVPRSCSSFLKERCNCQRHYRFKLTG